MFFHLSAVSMGGLAMDTNIHRLQHAIFALQTTFLGKGFEISEKMMQDRKSKLEAQLEEGDEEGLNNKASFMSSTSLPWEAAPDYARRYIDINKADNVDDQLNLMPPSVILSSPQEIYRPFTFNPSLAHNTNHG